MTTYCVKARAVGKKSWKFVTSKGGLNRLRIHASEIPTREKAEALAADINENNKGEYEAKVEVFSADPNDVPHYHASAPDSQTYEGLAGNCTLCSPELRAANHATLSAVADRPSET